MKKRDSDSDSDSSQAAWEGFFVVDMISIIKTGMMLFYCLLNAKTRGSSMVSSRMTGAKVYRCMGLWTVCSDTSNVLEIGIVETGNRTFGLA